MRSARRPGLIVGPGDPTGRFTYWPLRMAEAAKDGHGIIAPLPQATPIQWIDVRDLARWVLHVAEHNMQGVYDAVGPTLARQDFLNRLAKMHSPEPTAQWVSPDDLAELDVQPWVGPRSLPLWVPWEGWEHMMGRDPTPAAHAGLRPRELEDTALDTSVWAAQADPVTTGMNRSEELAVLSQLTSGSA